MNNNNSMISLNKILKEPNFNDIDQSYLKTKQKNNVEIYIIVLHGDRII